MVVMGSAAPSEAACEAVGEIQFICVSSGRKISPSCPAVSPNGDVMPDGQRFVMIKRGGVDTENLQSPQVVLAQHWAEELRGLMAIN